MPPISLLIKPASGNCNMKCDYCFYMDEAEKRDKKSYGFMTDQTLKNVIRKTISHAEGGFTLAFQGGEPTLSGIDFFKKAVEYVKQYNRNNIKVNYALQTNGFAINKEWCEFFKENGFLIGLSVDGTKETHDKFRHNQSGKDTYDRIIETSKLFDDFEVGYNILTVINGETSKIASEIYKDYKSKGWGFQQYITCLEPLNEEPGKKEFSLLPEDYGKFLVELFNMWYEDLQKGEQPYIRQFENYVMMEVGYLPESCEQRGICGIQYVVEADGSVYPCDFYALDDYLLGNFNTNSLSEVDNKRKEINFIERSKCLDDKCRECEFLKICRSGCYRSRINQINYFCEGYRLFFENCYDKIAEISDKIRK